MTLYQAEVCTATHIAITFAAPGPGKPDSASIQVKSPSLSGRESNHDSGIAIHPLPRQWRGDPLARGANLARRDERARRGPVTPPLPIDFAWGFA